MFCAQVYMVGEGGYDGDGLLWQRSTWCFNLTTKVWVELAPMLEKRCYVGTVLMDSRIVAVGGHDGRIRHNTVEEYDPV